MFVLNEAGGFVNLANYDQIPIVSTEPESVDGVANLGAKRAVVARKANTDEAGNVVYMTTVLADNLDMDTAVAVMRAIFEGLKKGVKVLDLQVFMSGRRAMSNGTKAVS
jgi:hypothetical protein